MQKNLKKVHFLKKFCLENLFRVTQPLNFFVQKSWLDMHMIVHKFQKNSSIRFKNSFNQSWTFRGHFLVFPVGSVWFDYVFSNFYDESFNLNRVRPLRST